LSPPGDIVGRSAGHRRIDDPCPIAAGGISSGICGAYLEMEPSRRREALAPRR